MSRIITDDTMMAGRPILEDNGIDFAHDAPMHYHHHGPIQCHGHHHRPVFIYGNGTSNGVLAYKGTISSESDLLNIRINKGECYIIDTAGEYAGQQCDVGDMIIVNISGSYTTSEDLSAAVSSLQSNVDMSDYITADDLTDYVTESDLDGYVTESDLDDYATTDMIATSPIADGATGFAIAGDVYQAIADAIGGGSSIVNTTYSLSKSGNVITLAGSDGSTYDVIDNDTDTDTNTTYQLDYSRPILSLVGSDGSNSDIELIDNQFWALNNYVHNVLAEEMADVQEALGNIGVDYSSSGSYRISTANVDTLTNGPHITLPAGKYVVTGTWTFQAGSSSGGRNLQVGFRSGTSGSLWTDRMRVFAAANNYAIVNISTIVTLSSQTDVYLAGSSSMTTSQDGNCYIKAIRIR